MKMERYRFEITGITPLLVNSPTSMKSNAGQIGTKKIPLPEDEAASKVYQDAKGNAIVPTTWFRMALLYAVGNKKVGKRSARSVVAASVFCVSDFCPLYDPETKKPIRAKDHEIDLRTAVVQKARVLRARPKFPSWSCVVEFELDSDLIQPQVVATNLDEAGKISGVGDFRPQKMGSFGRFNVTLLK